MIGNVEVRETAGRQAGIVIRPDAQCGNCSQRRDRHFFEGNQVYCNDHTTGDVFSTEPSEPLLLKLICEAEPTIAAKVVEKWQKKQGFIAIGPTTRIGCPDCGPVDVECDVFDDGKGISGECPTCGARLLFG